MTKRKLWQNSRLTLWKADDKLKKIYNLEDFMKKLFLAMILLTCVMGGMVLFAQERTPVQLPSSLSDYNNKGIKFTVTQPNIFKAVGKVADLGAVYFRDIPYAGQKTLIVKVRAMEGKFRWDHGKMFGLTFDSPNQPKGFIDPNPPSTKKTMDKLIDGPFEVGEELSFTLPADIAGQSKITFAMALYAGATYELELWFAD